MYVMCNFSKMHREFSNLQALYHSIYLAVWRCTEVQQSWQESVAHIFLRWRDWAFSSHPLWENKKPFRRLGTLTGIFSGDRKVWVKALLFNSISKYIYTRSLVHLTDGLMAALIWRHGAGKQQMLYKAVGGHWKSLWSWAHKTPKYHGFRYGYIWPYLCFKVSTSHLLQWQFVERGFSFFFQLL